MRAAQRERVAAAGRNSRSVLLRADGTQLLEFALLLPMLLVMVVGATDFGRAYNLKQKLTNAAREGARIAINQSTADLSQNVPNTVQAVRNSVVAYLNSENLDTSFIAANPTKTGVREWTYSSTSSGDPILRIDRSYPVPVTVDGTATLVISTRIRLAYPFSWSFARVINILKDCPQGSPGCYAGSFLIETEVIMKNMS